MTSKAEEIKLYKAIYELAFDREAHFFYTTDCDAILAFLKEKFWGESLEIRISLLCKILDFDAKVNPPLKKELKRKSKELKLLLTAQHQHLAGMD
jgi:hypothetical protein